MASKKHTSDDRSSKRLDKVADILFQQDNTPQVASFFNKSGKRKPGLPETGSTVPIRGSGLEEYIRTSATDSPDSATGQIEEMIQKGEKEFSPEPLECDPETEKVRCQYEKLPYPYRNLEDEKKRILVTGIDDLMIVNAYCYRGRRDFSRPFRVLVAGGGTGDALVYLAAQLRRHPTAEIVYVDLSTASLQFAKKRLRIQSETYRSRRMENLVDFRLGSLLDVADMDVGTFDYINCSGVLHHLHSPLEGLLALKSVLKEDGGMGIMVYGQVGRTSIYPIQEMLRILNTGIDDTEEKLHNTRLLLANLPSSNLHRKNGRWISPQINNIELYDLLLHSRDQAFTVEKLYDWAQAAGLHLSAFGKAPRPYLDFSTAPIQVSHRLGDRIRELDPKEQAVLMEYLQGNINCFEFYLTRSKDAALNINDLHAVPFYTTGSAYQHAREVLTTLPDENPERPVFHFPGHWATLKVVPEVTPVAKLLYKMIDNKRTLLEIIAQLVKTFHGYDESSIRAVLFPLLQRLIVYNIIELRHVSSKVDVLCTEYFKARKPLKKPELLFHEKR